MCPGPYRSAAPTWVPGSVHVSGRRQWNSITLGPGDGGAGRDGRWRWPFGEAGRGHSSPPRRQKRDVLARHLPPAPYSSRPPECLTIPQLCQVACQGFNKPQRCFQEKKKNPFSVYSIQSQFCHLPPRTCPLLQSPGGQAILSLRA